MQKDSLGSPRPRPRPTVQADPRGPHATPEGRHPGRADACPRRGDGQQTPRRDAHCHQAPCPSPALPGLGSSSRKTSSCPDRAPAPPGRCYAPELRPALCVARPPRSPPWRHEVDVLIITSLLLLLSCHLLPGSRKRAPRGRGNVIFSSAAQSFMELELIIFP